MSLTKQWLKAIITDCRHKERLKTGDGVKFFIEVALDEQGWIYKPEQIAAIIPIIINFDQEYEINIIKST